MLRQTRQEQQDAKPARDSAHLVVIENANWPDSEIRSRWSMSQTLRFAIGVCALFWVVAGVAAWMYFRTH
jgi:hypothetical protein